MFAQRTSGLSADFSVCSRNICTSSAQLPCIDWNIEEKRQAALDLFYEFQDGMARFEDLLPICSILQKKVDINRLALKWEQEYGIED